MTLFLRKTAVYLTLTAISTLMSCSTISSENETDKGAEKFNEIDQLLTSYYDKGEFNGTVLISENDSVIFKKAFGYADYQAEVKLKNSTSFGLASVSKQFTAMGIMILEKQNKLSYTDNLAKYFPEFPDYADQVSIEHLMTHTSGIADYFYDLQAYQPGLSNSDIFDMLINRESLEFTPGENFSYSNSGYILLSMIIEKISGVSFGEFMKTSVFEPLNMSQTFVHDESESQKPEYARGHDSDGTSCAYFSYTTGDAGIYSSTEDLFKWEQALYTEKLVSSAAIEKAYTSFELNSGAESFYGYGWYNETNSYGKVVSHAGGGSGYRTYIERHLDKKNSIIILTNRSDYKDGVIKAEIRNFLESNKQ